MSIKLTELTPILKEETCDNCGGIIEFHRQCDDGIHIFRKTKYWYEYKCKNCDNIIKSDFPMLLREIIFIDNKTGAEYNLVSVNGMSILV